MRSKVSVLADRIMQTLLPIMNNSKSSIVMEDALLTVGAICTAVEGDSLRYMESILPFLYNALQNHEEHALCSISIGIVGDLCRALNSQIFPFSAIVLQTFRRYPKSNHQEVLSN